MDIDLNHGDIFGHTDSHMARQDRPHDKSSITQAASLASITHLPEDEDERHAQATEAGDRVDPNSIVPSSLRKVRTSKQNLAISAPSNPPALIKTSSTKSLASLDGLGSKSVPVTGLRSRAPSVTDTPKSRGRAMSRSGDILMAGLSLGAAAALEAAEEWESQQAVVRRVRDGSESGSSRQGRDRSRSPYRRQPSERSLHTSEYQSAHPSHPVHPGHHNHPSHPSHSSHPSLSSHPNQPGRPGHDKAPADLIEPPRLAHLRLSSHMDPTTQQMLIDAGLADREHMEEVDLDDDANVHEPGLARTAVEEFIASNVGPTSQKPQVVGRSLVSVPSSHTLASYSPAISATAPTPRMNQIPPLSLGSTPGHPPHHFIVHTRTRTASIDGADDASSHRVGSRLATKSYVIPLGQEAGFASQFRSGEASDHKSEVRNKNEAHLAKPPVHIFREQSPDDNDTENDGFDSLDSDAFNSSQSGSSPRTQSPVWRPLGAGLSAKAPSSSPQPVPQAIHPSSQSTESKAKQLPIHDDDDDDDLLEGTRVTAALLDETDNDDDDEEDVVQYPWAKPRTEVKPKRDQPLKSSKTKMDQGAKSARERLRKLQLKAHLTLVAHQHLSHRPNQQDEASNLVSTLKLDEARLEQFSDSDLEPSVPEHAKPQDRSAEHPDERRSRRRKLRARKNLAMTVSDPSTGTKIRFVEPDNGNDSDDEAQGEQDEDNSPASSDNEHHSVSTLSQKLLGGSTKSLRTHHTAASFALARTETDPSKRLDALIGAHSDTRSTASLESIRIDGSVKGSSGAGSNQVTNDTQHQPRSPTPIAIVLAALTDGSSASASHEAGRQNAPLGIITVPPTRAQEPVEELSPRTPFDNADAEALLLGGSLASPVTPIETPAPAPEAKTPIPSLGFVAATAHHISSPHPDSYVHIHGLLGPKSYGSERQRTMVASASSHSLSLKRPDNSSTSSRVGGSADAQLGSQPTVGAADVAPKQPTKDDKSWHSITPPLPPSPQNFPSVEAKELQPSFPGSITVPDLTVANTYVQQLELHNRLQLLQQEYELLSLQLAHAQLSQSARSAQEELFRQKLLKHQLNYYALAQQLNNRTFARWTPQAGETEESQGDSFFTPGQLHFQNELMQEESGVGKLLPSIWSPQAGFLAKLPPLRPPPLDALVPQGIFLYDRECIFMRALDIELRKINRFCKLLERFYGAHLGRLATMAAELDAMRQRSAEQEMLALQSRHEKTSLLDRLVSKFRKASNDAGDENPRVVNQDSEGVPMDQNPPAEPEQPTVLSSAERRALKMEIAKTERTLQISLKELYRGLAMLSSYQELNRLAFVKIMKKHDKVSVGFKDASESVLLVVMNTHFVLSQEAKRMGHAVEQTYVKAFGSDAQGGRARAMQDLRIGHANSPYINLRVGFTLGVVSSIAVGLIALFTLYPDRSIASEAFLAGFPVFSALAYMMNAMWVWAAVVFACRQARIDHTLILQADPRTALLPSEIVDGASLFTFLWLVAFAVFSFVTSQDAPAAGPRYVLLGLVVTTLGVFLWPGRSFYYETRAYLGDLIVKTAKAPFSKAVFKEAFFADQLTSMVRLFQDLAYTVCYYTTGAFLTSDPSLSQTCTNTVGDYAWLLALAPFWFRLMQCLRRYYDTRYAFPHLANALKYLIAIAIAVLNILANHFYQHRTAVRAIWITVAVIGTVYAYYWDITQDWMLPQRHAAAARFFRIYIQNAKQICTENEMRALGILPSIVTADEVRSREQGKSFEASKVTEQPKEGSEPNNLSEPLVAPRRTSSDVDEASIPRLQKPKSKPRTISVEEIEMVPPTSVLRTSFRDELSTVPPMTKQDSRDVVQDNDVQSLQNAQDPGELKERTLLSPFQRSSSHVIPQRKSSHAGLRLDAQGVRFGGGVDDAVALAKARARKVEAIILNADSACCGSRWCLEKFSGIVRICCSISRAVRREQPDSDRDNTMELAPIAQGSNSPNESASTALSKDDEDDDYYDPDVAHLRIDDRCLACFLPKDFLTRQFVCGQHLFLYYIFAILNFFLRIAWVATVAPELFFSSVRTEYIFFGLALCEQYRRGIWSYLRLETEHIKNLNARRAVDLMGDVDGADGEDDDEEGDEAEAGGAGPRHVGTHANTALEAGAVTSADVKDTKTEEAPSETKSGVSAGESAKSTQEGKPARARASSRATAIDEDYYGDNPEGVAAMADPDAYAAHLSNLAQVLEKDNVKSRALARTRSQIAQQGSMLRSAASKQSIAHMLGLSAGPASGDMGVLPSSDANVSENESIGSDRPASTLGGNLDAAQGVDSSKVPPLPAHLDAIQVHHDHGHGLHVMPGVASPAPSITFSSSITTPTTPRFAHRTSGDHMTHFPNVDNIPPMGLARIPTTNSAISPVILSPRKPHDFVSTSTADAGLPPLPRHPHHVQAGISHVSHHHHSLSLPFTLPAGHFDPPSDQTQRRPDGINGTPYDARPVGDTMTSADAEAPNPLKDHTADDQ